MDQILTAVDMVKSDTEFIAVKAIGLTDSPDSASVLTTKANVHVDGQSFYQFGESASALDISEIVIYLNVLIEILVQQSNFYSQQQNGMNFLTNAGEMKDAIGVNYIMALNQLPSIPEHWDCNHFVVIQNIFTRISYQGRDSNRGFDVLVAMVTCTKLI